MCFNIFTRKQPETRVEFKRDEDNEKNEKEENQETETMDGLE
jgi:hypothetical protein